MRVLKLMFIAVTVLVAAVDGLVTTGFGSITILMGIYSWHCWEGEKNPFSILGVMFIMTTPLMLGFKYLMSEEITSEQLQMAWLILLVGVLVIVWSRTYGKRFEQQINKKMKRHPVLGPINYFLKPRMR